MEINWSKVAQSPGYKSLKAAYIKDVKEAAEKYTAKGRRPMRDKDTFLKLFNWVINRAKHYAHHLNKPIEEILNEWEKKRDYWWLNYYQPSRMPRLDYTRCKSMQARGMRKQYKKMYRNDPVAVKERMKRFFAEDNEQSKTKKDKPRWDKKRKWWYKALLKERALQKRNL